MTCGVLSDVEVHHVAGRHNDADLIVPLCVDCHRVLTSWQYAAGFELRQDAERTDADRERAVIVGLLHVVALAAARDPIPGAPEVLWTHTARAMSRILDITEPADRPGRWVPDSTANPLSADQVVPIAAHEETQVRQWMDLATVVVRRFGGVGPLTPELMEAITNQPASLSEQFARLQVEDHEGPALSALIMQHLDAAATVMHALLTVTDWYAVDERLLDEARIWIETGRLLLEKLMRLVPDGMRSHKSVREVAS